MSLVSTILLSAFLCTSVAVDSTDAVDSVAVAPERDSVSVSRGFNALEYRMQKRYRPKDETFVGGKFGDNLYLKFSLGAAQLAPRSYSSFSWGASAGVEIGKSLDRYNSLAIGVNGGIFRRNADGNRVYRGSLEVLHQFDISAYVGGYRTSRMLSVSTLEAIGLDLSRCSGGWHPAGHIRLGFDFNFLMARNFLLFLEPSVSLYTDGVDGHRSTNWQKYDFGYGFLSGLIARLPSGGAPYTLPTSPRSRGLSLDFSGGFSFQASDLVASTVGILPSSREAVSLAIGIPVEGPLSVRMSLFYSRDIWKRLGGIENKTAIYGGLRGELMFNPMYYSKQSKGFFSLPLLLGPEYGILLKKDQGYNLRKAYLGLSAGFQLRFRVAPRLSLYLEPHLSIVPYNYRKSLSESISNATANYFDTLYSFCLGFSIPL